MQTDTVKIEKAVIRLIDYSWNDEMKNFEEEYEVEIQSQDNLEPWIEWCEQTGNITHIFYHLMVLKSAYPELF